MFSLSYSHPYQISTELSMWNNQPFF